MEIQEIKNEEKKPFNDFVADSPYGGFLQSTDWGDFKGQFEWTADRFVLLENKKIVAAAQILNRLLPGGVSMIYVPEGPVLDWTDERSEYRFRELLHFIIEKNSATKPVFIRIEPLVETGGKTGEKIKKILKENGFKKAIADIQPKDTLLIDLKKSKEEILESMHSKGRYNIRLALKKGVHISEKADGKTIKHFIELHRQTAVRDRFHTHNTKYFEELIKKFIENKTGRLFSAWYDGKLIAGIFVIFFGNRATYLYGGSASIYRNLMPNHGLQWQAILDAKKEGLSIYDFWGIADPSAKKHSWAGITRFKMQFGGNAVTYLGAYDLPINKYKYYSLRQLERFRAGVLKLSR